MRLHFDTNKVRKLLKHSKRTKTHRQLYGNPTGEGLLLVGDDGVYLMSSGVCKGKPNVVYADEVNPYTMPFDAWWHNKQVSFGGDDGVEFIPIKEVEFILNPNVESFGINLTKSGYSMFATEVKGV